MHWDATEENLTHKNCVYVDETAVGTSRLQIDIMYFGDLIIGIKCQLGPDTQSTKSLLSTILLTINQSYWFWIFYRNMGIHFFGYNSAKCCSFDKKEN